MLIQPQWYHADVKSRPVSCSTRVAAIATPAGLWIAGVPIAEECSETPFAEDLDLDRFRIRSGGRLEGFAS